MIRLINLSRTIFLSVVLCVASSSCAKILKEPGQISVSVAAENLSTKGTVITNANIANYPPCGSFKMSAYLDEPATDNETGSVISTDYFEEVSVNYSDGEWVMQAEYNWVNGILTRFWSYAPVSLNGSLTLNPRHLDLSGASKLEFEYSLPLPCAASPYNDAANQDDLLFAYSAKTWSESSHTSHEYDKVDVRFFHALTWVRFMVDTTDGFDDGLDITNIQLSGINSSASCLFDPTKLANSDKFSWSGQSVLRDYSQDMTRDDFNVTHSNGHGKLSSPSLAFLIIPQTVPASSTITVCFKRKLDGSLVTRSASLNNQTFLPGRYYTYKLSAMALDDQISFNVSLVDWVDGGSGNI